MASGTGTLMTWPRPGDPMPRRAGRCFEARAGLLGREGFRGFILGCVQGGPEALSVPAEEQVVKRGMMFMSSVKRQGAYVRRQTSNNGCCGSLGRERDVGDDTSGPVDDRL